MCCAFLWYVKSCRSFTKILIFPTQRTMGCSSSARSVGSSFHSHGTSWGCWTKT